MIANRSNKNNNDERLRLIIKERENKYTDINGGFNVVIRICKNYIFLMKTNNHQLEWVIKATRKWSDNEPIEWGRGD